MSSDPIADPRAAAVLPALTPAFRRLASAAARLPWTTAGMIAALTLGCGLLGILSFGSDLRDSSGADVPFEWAAGLDQFLGTVNERMVFQFVIALIAVGAIAERLLPARREATSRGLNIAYGLLVVLFIAATGPLQVVLADRIFRWTGWSPVFDLRFDTQHRVPLAIAAMLISALIVDFFFYWFHRLQHTSKLLWQAHLLHHTDMALNVTTTNRTHFFEHMLTPLFMATPITLLFALPRADIIVIAVVPLVWSHFVHANLRIGFGRLWWLLSSPQYHRIHHSIRSEHQNKNFAVWFPLWDILFGTAFAPRRGEYPETGVDGVVVGSFAEALTLPCVGWHRMARRALTRDRGGETGYGA